MIGLVRSRWAAIGAAVAVTLGAGGLVSVSADSAESVFVAVSPARVLDTRVPVGLDGPLVNGEAEKLTVTGAVPVIDADNNVADQTVVPAGATAIVANVTAVGPTTIGYVSVRPGTATGVPSTSNINITQAGDILPNSVTVELASNGTVDLFFFGTATGATTDLLVDIVGYYVEGGAGVPGPKGDTGDPGPKGDTGATGAPASANSESFRWSISGPADSFSTPTSSDTVPNGWTTIPLSATMSITSTDPICVNGYFLRIRGGGVGAGGIFWDFSFNSAGTLTNSYQVNSSHVNNSGLSRPLFLTASCEGAGGPEFDFDISVTGTFTFQLERPPTTFS